MDSSDFLAIIEVCILKGILSNSFRAKLCHHLAKWLNEKHNSFQHNKQFAEQIIKDKLTVISKMSIKRQNIQLIRNVGQSILILPPDASAIPKPFITILLFSFYEHADRIPSLL